MEEREREKEGGKKGDCFLEISNDARRWIFFCIFCSGDENWLINWNVIRVNLTLCVKN